jgi:hypothetical protein
MKDALSRQAQPTAAAKQLEQKRTGNTGMPVFYRLTEYYDIVDNTINDLMHLFYNVILLIFEFMIRKKFNQYREKQFMSEGRKLAEQYGPDDWDYIDMDAAFKRECGGRMGWQASNERLKELIKTRKLRQVPGSDAGNMDCPFAMNKDGPALLIDSSAQWLRLISSMGVYYIYMLDLHDAYKEAFAHTLWWMYMLRRRFTVKDMLDPNKKTAGKKGDITLVEWGKERLARLESIMPRPFCTLVMHLMQHACKTLRLAGPPHAHWMFPFERWVKLPKARLHSALGAARSIMKQMMEHEWITLLPLSSEEDRKSLMQPPLSHFPDKRFVEVLGTAKHVTLIPRSDYKDDYSLIFRYLISNDTSLTILNDEFQRANPTYRQGKIVFRLWKPSNDSMFNVLEKLRVLHNRNDITDVDVMLMIKGPPREVHEFHRFSVNGVTFCTRSKESAKARCTRRFLYYRNEGAKGNDGTVINKMVAQVERIYQVLSTSCMKTQTLHTLIRVKNYQYVDGEHPSQLPHVEPAVANYDLFKGMPVINANDVFPVNIACWPASLAANNTFLVVQSETE